MLDVTCNPAGCVARGECVECRDMFTGNRCSSTLWCPQQQSLRAALLGTTCNSFNTRVAPQLTFCRYRFTDNSSARQIKCTSSPRRTVRIRCARVSPSQHQYSRNVRYRSRNSFDRRNGPPWVRSLEQICLQHWAYKFASNTGRRLPRYRLHPDPARAASSALMVEH